ncbi:MAG: DUF983 domain-containing protein [Actinomycetota bacterium]|jgi:uncharacterized protein (DUF983 family)|nr:DUF983 domain-containing protein [Actinomycetota bacterium]
MTRTLWRGLTLGCGVCGQRRLFRRFRLYSMRENCPRCGLHFERIEGHWLGAVAVNTVISAALVLIALALAMVIFGTDTPRGTLLLMVLPFGTIFPTLFDPFSRTLWTAVDVLIRPPGPDEVDLPFARTTGNKPFLPDLEPPTETS